MVSARGYRKQNLTLRGMTTLCQRVNITKPYQGKLPPPPTCFHVMFCEINMPRYIIKRFWIIFRFFGFVFYPAELELWNKNSDKQI